VIPHPPQLPSYGITRDVRLRYQSLASQSVSITFQNLLDSILVAATTILGYDLFDAVRVNSIEVWAIAAVGTPATVTVVFSGETVGQAGDQKAHTDTSMGIEPAHVKARPDPLTQAGQFQASAANTAFLLEVPVNAIIDLSLTLRQPVLGQANACQNALVGAAPGTVYYRGMDGKNVATTTFPVVGTLTTN
jgi:hypothetical protein